MTDVRIEAAGTPPIIIGMPGSPVPAGPGVPVGGAAGQALVKASAADRDTMWADLAPVGGAVSSVDGRTGAVTLSDLYQAIGSYYTQIETDAAIAAAVAGGGSGNEIWINVTDAPYNAVGSGSDTDATVNYPVPGTTLTDVSLPGEFVRFNSTPAGCELHSIVGGYDGRTIRIYNNNGTNNLTLKANGTATLTSSKLSLGSAGSVALGLYQTATLRYSGIDSRWMLVSIV